MNTQAINDAIARWEGYRDRGIAPKKGWGSGEGGGGSCALGDIAFYSKIDTSCEAQMGAARVLFNHLGHHGEMMAVKQGALNCAHEFPVITALGISVAEARLLVSVNDHQGRWPIEEAKRIVSGRPREVRMLAPMGGLVEFIKSQPNHPSDHFKWHAEALTPIEAYGLTQVAA